MMMHPGAVAALKEFMGTLGGMVKEAVKDVDEWITMEGIK